MIWSALHNSEQTSCDQRRVLLKMPAEKSNQSQRRVLLPIGESKSDQATPETCPPPPPPPPGSAVSSCLQDKEACREELEFLKLKLRYMQNDIDFKKSKLEMANTFQGGPKIRNSAWIKPSPLVSNPAEFVPNSSLSEAVKRGWSNPSTSLQRTWSEKVNNLSVRDHEPTCFKNTMGVVHPTNSSSITRATNISAVYSMASGSKFPPKSALDRPAGSSFAVPFSPSPAPPVSVPQSMTDHNLTQKLSTLIQSHSPVLNAVVSSQSDPVSRKLKPVQSKHSPLLFLPSDNVHPHSASIKISPQFPRGQPYLASSTRSIKSLSEHTSDKSSSGFLSKNAAHSLSKYKLVRNPTVFSTTTTPNSSPRSDSYQRIDRQSPNCMTPSHSSPISTAVTTKLKRIPSVGNLSLKISSSRVQAAAKLVSKYKLQRLSPTTCLQIPPFLNQHKALLIKSSIYHSKERKRQSFLARQQQYRLIPSQLIRNTATLNPTYKKLAGSSVKLYRGAPFIRRHKIDRRSRLAPPCSELKVITNRGNAWNSRFSVRNQHKRTFKYLLNKSSSNTSNKADSKDLQLWARGGRVKHKAGSTKPASKYTWQKSNLGKGKHSPNVLNSHSSRFKWASPSLQIEQDSAWQNLRHKLKILLARKHRSLRKHYLGIKPYNRTSKLTDSKTKLVVIDGVTFESSSRKLTRTRRFSSGSGKSGPPQFEYGNKTLNKATSAVLPGPCSKRHSSSSHSETRLVNYASRALHRSIAIAAAKYKKNNKKSQAKTQHCIFFGRFGRCHRGDKCPFTHDPDKVVVCTRFLRGKCDTKDCPFSHKASLNKMPVCLFYLKGACSREQCPYLHVRVNPGAPVCRDFLNGFCIHGDKCKKIHSRVCPSFAMTGQCSRGATCLMLHRCSHKDQPRQATSSRKQQERLVLRKQKMGSVKTFSLGNSTEQTAEADKIILKPSVSLTPQPAFISLGESSHLSFISLTSSINEQDKNSGNDLSLPKSVSSSDDVKASIFEETAHKVSPCVTPNIRPSFLTTKGSNNTSSPCQSPSKHNK